MAVSEEINKLAFNVYADDKKEDAEMAAKTLIQLIPSYSADDNAEVLRRLNMCLDSSSSWRREFAMEVIVAVRNFGPKNKP